MKLYLLVESNSSGKTDDVVAVCTTKAKAIDMLRTWYENELSSLSMSVRMELEHKLEIDEKYVCLSYASIRGREESEFDHAYKCLNIDEYEPNSWRK